MTKLLYLGLVAFALAAFVAPSSVEAQCTYSNGYSRYAPAVQYSNSYYAPSYGYGNSYYAPSYQYGSNNYGRNYNNVRSQNVRRLATAAIVAGVIVAAANSDGNRNRNRNRNRGH